MLMLDTFIEFRRRVVFSKFAHCQNWWSWCHLPLLFQILAAYSAICYVPRAYATSTGAATEERRV